MFDLSILTHARWQDIYLLLASGSPPVVVRLLVINTLFLLYFIFRKLRNRSSRPYTTSLILQSLLIGANFMLMFQHQLTPMIMRNPGADYSRAVFDIMFKTFFG